VSELPTNYLLRRPRERTASVGPRTGADFSGPTVAWLKGTAIERRKSLGQYMTPVGIRELLLDLTDTSVANVLDPGVGTGEFLASFQLRNPDARLVGWDVDPAVAAVARELVPAAQIEVRDALEAVPAEEFDLVIGNPPYFQFTGRPSLRKRFERVISGRPNIFSLFFQVGLEALREGGQLAYVVPTSMNSGAYFAALREFILDNAAIEHLVTVKESDAFVDAQTSVQIIVLRKGAASDRHVFTRRLPDGSRRRAFSEDPARLEAMFTGRATLHELGYAARTGQVVWNQARERLRMAGDDAGAVRLVWARDIQDGTLAAPVADETKSSFVVVDEPLVGPAVVVNRIVGAVGRAHIRAAVVPAGLPFVGENHVNVILPRDGVSPSISLEELCRLLCAPETGERLSSITGNTQVSATELNHLLPLG
jgi:adenine-specific DNA-methyltransferase